LYNQYNSIAALKRVAIIGHILLERIRNHTRRDGAYRCARQASNVLELGYKPQGQVERERAALPWVADEHQLATQHSRNLAADRKTETCTAVFSARRAIGLLKRLENDALFFFGNADPGVLYRKRQNLLGLCQISIGMGPARLSERNPQPNVAFFGEFEGVRKQILDDLLKALVVGEQRAGKFGIQIHAEIELLVLSELRESAQHIGAQLRKRRL